MSAASWRAPQTHSLSIANERLRTHISCCLRVWARLVLRSRLRTHGGTCCAASSIDTALRAAMVAETGLRGSVASAPMRRVRLGFSAAGMPPTRGSGARRLSPFTGRSRTDEAIGTCRRSCGIRPRETRGRGHLSPASRSLRLGLGFSCCRSRPVLRTGRCARLARCVAARDSQQRAPPRRPFRLETPPVVFTRTALKRATPRPPSTGAPSVEAR